MSFDLKSIRSTKKNVPTRILTHGPHKVGKSTFAAQSEKPIFVPTEDGQDNIDAQAFPLCKKWDDVMSCVTTLYRDEHDFKTVVLDSADWAESLAWAKVAQDHDVKGIESIGYGKGYVFAADLFRELLDGLNALRLERGMQVIVLCHSEIKRFDDPQADSYDRYQIKLHKLVNKMVQEWADIIAFAQQDMATKTEETGFGNKRVRAIDIDRRVLRLKGSAAYDAGTRYEMPATVPLIWSEFEKELTKAKSG